eukprot:scaffold40234_cov68-Phaeocystis_antarctica.AAC.13
MGPAERRKLLILLSNMTGLKAAELRGFYAALELVVDPEAPVARPGGLKCDNKREFKTQEVLDKLDKLGAFELLLGDSTHPRPLNSMRGGAARMHEESVLRRKQSPPAPATIELEPGTLKLEPAAAPEVVIAGTLKLEPAAAPELRRARSQRPAEHLKSPHRKLLRECVADEKALRVGCGSGERENRKGKVVVRIAARPSGRERRWKMCG